MFPSSYLLEISVTSPFGPAVDLEQHMRRKQAERQARSDEAGKTDRVDATEVYDSEVLAIEKVMLSLRQYAGHRSIDLDSFDRQIQERFAEIGFRVDVHWHETNQADVYMPEVNIVGRTERRGFDREQQRHEIVNDILGTGQKGTIKVDPSQIKAASGGHRH